MKVQIDLSKTEYHEREDVEEFFTREELRRLRQLLRRLRFLEAQVRERGGMADPRANGGAAHAELEIEAFEFVLTEMEYMEIKRLKS